MQPKYFGTNSMAQQENPKIRKCEDPSIDQEYRERLEGIKTRIGHYTGVSEEFEDLMSLMHDLECWMQSVFGQEGERRLSTEMERSISTAILNEPCNAIDDLLDRMGEKYEVWIKKCLDEPASGNMLIVNMEAVLLPPQELPVNASVTGENKFEVARFEDRLVQLLVMLNREGICSDDLIIIRGTVDPNMMRKEPYVLVEIPCIERQILICDEVGEAAFVIRGVFDRNKFTQLDKEELQLQYPQQVRRVVYHNFDHWRKSIKEYIFEDIDRIEKVDVRKEEDLRRAVKRIIPTAAEWSALSIRKLKKLRFNGLGFKALASKFGIRGRRNRSLQLKVGRKIYGDHELLREWTADEIREEVKLLLPTAEDWLNLPVRERSHFRVHAIGLMTLTGLLGEHFNPFDRKSDYLKLGRMIYGNEEILQEKEYTLDEIVAAIKEQMPTAEAWMLNPARERKEITACEMGLHAIAARFGMQIKGYIGYIEYRDMGKKIYGDDPIFEMDERTMKSFRLRRRKDIPESEEERVYCEKLREALKSEVPTPEKWAELTAPKRQDLKVFEMGLMAIATRLDVEGDPIRHTSVHLELGRAVYGDVEVLREKKLMLEELREAAMAEIPTPEVWVNMQVRKRKKIKICGLGLVALSTRFGLSGDPVQSSSLYLELGQRIFGECDILRNWTLDEIREEIKKTIPTYEDWMRLKQREKQNYIVCNMKMNRLARRFGIKGDPIASRKVQSELGKLIYLK